MDCGSINIDDEQLLGLREAAAYVTKKFRDRRGGRKLHISTICRWVSRGIGGVRLETSMIGGTRATSVEALGRFFNRLSGGNPPPTAAAGSSGHSPPSPKLDGGRRRRIKAAEDALDQVGI